MSETHVSTDPASGGARLQLRLLGPLGVVHDGLALELPGSRKVRALLAYLALAPRPVARRQLCDLFWDAPGDPRGELRWCLSRMRGVVDAARIVSVDDAVRLDLVDCFVDVLAVEHAAKAGIATLTPARVRELVALFGGEFLEGLDLDHCPLFSAWLLAQRRRLRALHAALLERLVDSARDNDDFDDLEHWLALAPFELRAHERLLGALALRGRFREGVEHLAASVRLFAAEGLDSTPLRRAWSAARKHGAGLARLEPALPGETNETEYYRHGRRHLARMMRHGLEAGREMFIRAIELDTAYAPAWAGLAIVHAGLADWFGAGAAGIARAEQASRRALEVAPHLAEAHAARGLARSLSRQYDEAAREFEEAIRLDPYLFDGYYYYARTAFACGDMQRAAEMFGLAAELCPEDVQSPGLRCTALRALGRESAANDAALMGIRRAEGVLALDPRDGRALSLGAGALQDAGQAGLALEWSRRSLELYPDDASALVNSACVHARAGLKGEALDMLERVFARGCGKRDWVVNDPDYAPLRDDPRFQRLLAGIS